MSGHRNFNELRAKMSPESRQRSHEMANEMHREYVLSEIRRQVGLTQCEMADRLNVSQPAYSCYENGKDIRIGTLSRIVTGMGGSLSILVHIDGQDFPMRFDNEPSMAMA